MMGLAKRIIPTLLVRGRQLVKGTQFNAWRSVGHAVQAVRIHQARGVDELVILDIAATQEGRGPDLGLVDELTRDCFMPLAVGGGVRTVEDVRALLKAGADKVVIGRGAHSESTLISDCRRTVGAQAVVVAIDVKDGRVRHMGAGPGPVRWAQWLQDVGAGEVLLTSVEREGRMCGYDLDLIRAVSSAVSIPVIAHGGCGTYEHMREAIEAGADAVAAGAMFLFSDNTPAGAAKYLQEHNIEVRV